MLCLISACNDFYLLQPKSSALALTHLTQTFQLLARRLSGDEALSELTFALVIGLVIYAQLRGDMSSWRIHMRGLSRLVDMKGGIAQLSDPILLQKTCRADIDFALSAGCVPQWRLEEIRFTARYPQNYTAPHLPVAFQNLQHTLRSIANDVFSLADVLDRSSPQNKMGPVAFQETLLALCYRLLQPGPFSSPYHGSTLDYGCQMGMIAFLTTLMFQFGRRRLLHHEALSSRFRSFVQGYHQDISNQEGLLLWLLFIGRLSILSTSDDKWLIPRIAQEVGNAGIVEWAGLREALARFPWIASLHSAPAEQLWIQATKRI